MIDAISNSAESRCMSLKGHLQNFGFLYDIDKLKCMIKEEINKCCKNLDKVLHVEEDSVIKVSEFFEEIQVMLSFLPDYI